MDKITHKVLCEDEDGCICVDLNSVKTEVKKGDYCEHKSDGEKTQYTLSKTNPTINCDDVDGCICLYNDDSSTRIEIGLGQTCTLEKKVEPATSNVCCYYNESLKYMPKSYCDLHGVEVDTITEESKCLSYKMRLSFKKGSNFIQAVDSLDFEKQMNTAKKLINLSKYKITVVGEFIGNKWMNIVKYSNGTVYGTDFDLEVGKIYYVYAEEDFDLDITTYAPINMNVGIGGLSGWNLIPTYIFSDESTSMEILKNKTYNITGVAQWDNAVSLFIYNILGNSDVYGTDIDLYKDDGIFVKIEKAK